MQRTSLPHSLAASVFWIQSHNLGTIFYLFYVFAVKCTVLAKSLTAEFVSYIKK